MIQDRDSLLLLGGDEGDRDLLTSCPDLLSIEVNLLAEVLVLDPYTFLDTRS